MDAPPQSSTSSAASFPILAITLLGMLTTAFVLISYYLLLVKCRLSWRLSDLRRRVFLPSAGHSRRHLHLHIPPLIHAMAAAELHGLDPAVIRSIPVVKFTGAGGSATCAICLSELQEEERVKLLPVCAHAFHVDCIDTWLEFNANCPLCRSAVTSTSVGLAADHIVVLAPRRENGAAEARDSETEVAVDPSPRWKRRKYRQKVGSMGDEFIDPRGKCEQFCVQPMRRSFSMDSSNDRHLILSIQEILRQKQPGSGNGEGSSSSSNVCRGDGSGSGRIRRSLFFSFGRSSRSSVLPTVEVDV